MRKLIFGIFCLITLSLCTRSAFAQIRSEWVLAGVGKDSMSFIDSKSVSGEDDYLVGWLIRYNSHSRSVMNGRGVGYHVSRYAWNCHTRQLANITSAFYDRTGTLLESTSTIEPYEYEWEYAIPDSLGAIELETACYYAPDSSYYSELPEIIRKRRELGVEDYYIAESIQETIKYATEIMPWTKMPIKPKPKAVNPKKASTKRKK